MSIGTEDGRCVGNLAGMVRGECPSIDRGGRERQSVAVFGGLCRIKRGASREDMDTNLDLGGKLLEEARRVGWHKTKKATVTEALKEYIRRRKQKRVLSLFGKMEWDPAYHYKASRRDRCMSLPTHPCGHRP